MQCGPIRVRVDPKRQTRLREFDHTVIFKYTDFLLPPELAEPTIQEVFQRIVRYDARNRILIEDIIRAVREGRSPLVLTERVEHLEFLAGEIEKEIEHVVVLRGGMGKREQAAIDETLREIPDDTPRVILATGRYIGEGFDNPRLDTLFMAFPISWRGTLQQYVGRLHRNHSSKKEVQVYDYVDQHIPVLVRMYEKRLKGYRSMGYSIKD